MKASLDTNVLISYLLFPDRETTSRKIVWAGLREDFQLKLSEQTLSELVDTIRSSEYLSQRIEEPFLGELIEQLRSIGVISPGYIREDIRVARDPKDDYLIAHALATDVDYLVTGDKDLLVLDHVGRVIIVTPAEMLALLRIEMSGSDKF